MLAELSYGQQLNLLLIDKLAVAAILAALGYAINRKLEAYKAAQARNLEVAKKDLSLVEDARSRVVEVELRLDGAMHQFKLIMATQCGRTDESLDDVYFRLTHSVEPFSPSSEAIGHVKDDVVRMCEKVRESIASAQVTISNSRDAVPNAFYLPYVTYLSCARRLVEHIASFAEAPSWNLMALAADEGAFQLARNAIGGTIWEFRRSGWANA